MRDICTAVYGYCYTYLSKYKCVAISNFDCWLLGPSQPYNLSIKFKGVTLIHAVKTINLNVKIKT